MHRRFGRILLPAGWTEHFADISFPIASGRRKAGVRTSCGSDTSLGFILWHAAPVVIRRRRGNVLDTNRGKAGPLSCEIDCADYAGRSVHLTHVGWERHCCQRHPEVAPYHDRVPSVVREPHVVVETEDQDLHYYRLGVGDGRYANLYLRIITEPSTGRIRTVHFIRTVDNEGKVVYFAPGWSS